MKQLFKIICLVFLCFSANIFSQNIVGDWYGKLELPGMNLRILFHVTESEGIYTTTMDSPDQGANDIPTTATTFNKNILSIHIENMGISYKGTLKNKTITGIFIQNGHEISLTLSKEITKAVIQKRRPQDPIKPYKYHSEEVFFLNKKANNIKLAGTLTLPKNVKKPAVVILISGSGPQNRDEEIKMFNHRPFLVLSDYLTNKGIAVLRFDDRGVADSEGDREHATSADYATDVEAAVAYLKTRADIVDTSKIGLIGHSEGGLIATMVASEDKNIGYIVLLASPGVSGDKVLLSQTRKAGELAGVSVKVLDLNERLSKELFLIVKNETNTKKIKEKAIVYLTTFKNENSISESEKSSLSKKKIEKQANSITSDWICFFIRTNPSVFLQKINCPVLAINGEKDFQVLPKLNLEGISKALKKAKNKDITIQEIKGLNHLFQTAITGSASEYKAIEETFSPTALKIIADWINKRF